ncbi:MAG: DUF4435 domain-containing protein [Clostridiaceae bacterium]|nr:DUF4435 domain-containing protein [Clostridiaceae bacterium]
MTTDKFISAPNDSEMTPIFKLVTYPHSPIVKLYCVVEGKDDKVFYEKAIPSQLKYKEDQVICIDVGGKDAVYNTLLRIITYHYKMRKNTKSAFIVDRDYDGLKKAWDNESVKEKLTVLPYYSIENYFFAPGKNLETIFRCFFINWKGYLEEFINELTAFIQAVSEYCAWKKICICYPEKTKALYYKEQDSVENCDSAAYYLSRLTYPFCLDKGFNEFVAAAIEELRESHVKLYKKLLKEKEILQRKIQLIRGKTLLSFLLKYLYYRLNEGDDDLKDRVFSLSGSIYFDLDIKELEL